MYQDQKRAAGGLISRLRKRRFPFVQIAADQFYCIKLAINAVFIKKFSTTNTNQVWRLGTLQDR